MHFGNELHKYSELYDLSLEKLDTSKDRVLNKLPTSFNSDLDFDTDHHFTVLDTETTGLEDDDEVIALHYLMVKFSDDFEQFKVFADYTMYREPSKEISEEITKLTGITYEDVRGKEIPNCLIEEIFDVDFVVAHNAEFDKKKIEYTFPNTKLNVPWGCTSKDIDWKSKGCATTSLASLVAQYLKCYMTHHDPKQDSWASFWLAFLNFKELTEAIYKDTYRVYAHKSPFDNKDNLKSAGFKWSSEDRVWFIDVLSDDLEKFEEIVKENLGEPESILIQPELRI